MRRPPFDLSSELLIGYANVMKRPEISRQATWGEYTDMLLGQIGTALVTVTPNKAIYPYPGVESPIQVDNKFWARQALRTEDDFTKMQFGGETPQGTEHSFRTPNYRVGFARTHTGQLSRLALVGSEVRALISAPDMGGTTKLHGVARIIAQDTSVSPPQTQIHSYLSVRR